MNVERLKQAIEIIKDIPDAQLNLLRWQSGEVIAFSQEKATCTTIACAGGWLALHPDMQAQGLHIANNYGAPEYGDTAAGYAALAAFFDIDLNLSEELFSYRTNYENAPASKTKGLTDKQLWLYRANRVLNNYLAAQDTQ